MVGEDHEPNCVVVSKNDPCPVPSVSWHYVSTYEGLIILVCNFSRTMWQSISMCFVCSSNTGFAVICNLAWLSQKSWACNLHDILSPATDIATKLSLNNYWSLRGASAFVYFFDFHEIIEEPRKMFGWQPPQFESQ